MQGAAAVPSPREIYPYEYQNSEDDEALIKMMHHAFRISSTVAQYCFERAVGADLSYVAAVQDMLVEKFTPIFQQTEEITVAFLDIDGVLNLHDLPPADLYAHALQALEDEDEIPEKLHPARAVSSFFPQETVNHFMRFWQAIVRRKVIWLSSEWRLKNCVLDMQVTLQEHDFSNFIVARTAEELSKEREKEMTGRYAPHFLKSEEEVDAELQNVPNPGKSREQWLVAQWAFSHRTLKVLDIVERYPHLHYVVIDDLPLGDIYINEALHYRCPFGDRFIRIDPDKLFTSADGAKALQCLSKGYPR